MNTYTAKRLLLYSGGLFLIALGATLSILAGLGVSPVTSLPYTLVLITGLSIGIMTVTANVVYIIMQAIFLKQWKWRNFSIQLIITFVFGFFMDFTLWLLGILPDATNYVMSTFYLVMSLLIVAMGLLLYFTAAFPMMPYDSLTYVISEKWALVFGKAKIWSDLTNVVVSLVLCVAFLQATGSIGIGTFIAAYGIGKVVGVVLPKYQPVLIRWLEH